MRCWGRSRGWGGQGLFPFFPHGSKAPLFGEGEALCLRGEGKMADNFLPRCARKKRGLELGAVTLPSLLLAQAGPWAALCLALNCSGAAQPGSGTLISAAGI